MKVGYAIACLLAAPGAVAFHVAVPTSLQRGGFVPSAASSAAAVHRSAAAARRAPRSMSAQSTARMSQLRGGGVRDEEDAKARRLSTLLSASAVVVAESSSGGVVESLRGGGGEIVQESKDNLAQATKENKLFQAYETAARWFTNLFPIWLCVFSGIALKDPAVFAWFTTE